MKHFLFQSFIFINYPIDTSVTLFPYFNYTDVSKTKTPYLFDVLEGKDSHLYLFLAETGTNDGGRWKFKKYFGFSQMYNQPTKINLQKIVELTQKIRKFKLIWKEEK